MGNEPINKNQEANINEIKQMYLDLLSIQKSYIVNLQNLNMKNQNRLERKISILQKEVDEYRGFKKGKIWKFIEIYRNI